MQLPVKRILSYFSYLVVVVTCLLTYLYLLLLIHIRDDITFLATRMAVAFGKINSFNPSQDEWSLYVERLGHICSKWDYRRRKEASSFSFSNWSKYIQTLVIDYRGARSPSIIYALVESFSSCQTWREVLYIPCRYTFRTF